MNPASNAPFQRVRPVLGCAGALLLLASCGEVEDPAAATPGVTAVEAAALPAGAQPHAHAATVHGGVITPAARADLARLRAATARFQRFEAGWDAGFQVLVRHPITEAGCLVDPEFGGMGRHYLDTGRVTTELAVESPQVLLYEPTREGRLRLVGVEYIVPFDLWPRDAAPPVLFGLPFMPNETFGVWALHVWAWSDNPGGMFADWNPRVNCDFDGAVPG